MEDQKRRTETLKFRATLDEILTVDEKAFELNLTRSQYLRKLVFEKDVVLYDFSGLDQLTAEIGKIGVNVNQIAKKLNQGGELERENAEFLIASINRIHDAVKKIYTDTMKKKSEG